MVRQANLSHLRLITLSHSWGSHDEVMVALEISTQVLAKVFTRSSCDEVTVLTFFPGSCNFCIYVVVVDKQFKTDFLSHKQNGDYCLQWAAPVYTVLHTGSPSLTHWLPVTDNDKLLLLRSTVTVAT